jgi:predicted nucleic acid-binding Zn ribbon protein
MPTYESVCLKCGKYHTYTTQMRFSHETPECCGQKTDKRILTAPMGVMDYQPWEAYESPASGKMITSKADRAKDFKATGTRPWEGREQEEKEAARLKAYDEQKMDAELDKTVRQAWASLSPAKKAQALAEAK